jgi:hypothetical protein
MIPNKTTMDSYQIPAKKPALIMFLLRKAVVIALVTLVFGWLYGWAAPWAYATKQPAGFTCGLLHGAMMPLSLPSLVIGKDVPIYAVENSGRPYKIGYICGVNICGLVFIGPLFWRPRRPVPVTSTSSGKSQ